MKAKLGFECCELTVKIQLDGVNVSPRIHIKEPSPNGPGLRSQRTSAIYVGRCTSCEEVFHIVLEIARASEQELPIKDLQAEVL